MVESTGRGEQASLGRVVWEVAQPVVLSGCETHCGQWLGPWGTEKLI